MLDSVVQSGSKPMLASMALGGTRTILASVIFRVARGLCSIVWAQNGPKSILASGLQRIHAARGPCSPAWSQVVRRLLTLAWSSVARCICSLAWSMLIRSQGADGE